MDMQTESRFTPFNFVDKLQPTEWKALQEIARTQVVDKNTYIFRANELNDAIYVLLEGRVKIKRLSKHGRELIQWFCLPGEIFGLAEDSINHHRGLYAQALTQAKTLCIQKNIFTQYLIQKPHISFLIVEQLASRLRTVGDMLLNISSEDAHVRLIHLLQRLSEFFGRDYGTGVYVDIYLTHQELADMIGVCRQTVSTMIGRLKQQDIIDTNRNGFIIKSPSRLHEFSMQPLALA